MRLDMLQGAAKWPLVSGVMGVASPAWDTAIGVPEKLINHAVGWLTDNDKLKEQPILGWKIQGNEYWFKTTDAQGNAMPLGGINPQTRNYETGWDAYAKYNLVPSMIEAPKSGLLMGPAIGIAMRDPVNLFPTGKMQTLKATLAQYPGLSKPLGLGRWLADKSWGFSETKGLLGSTPKLAAFTNEVNSLVGVSGFVTGVDRGLQSLNQIGYLADNLAGKYYQNEALQNRLSQPYENALKAYDQVAFSKPERETLGWYLLFQKANYNSDKASFIVERNRTADGKVNEQVVNRWFSVINEKGGWAPAVAGSRDFQREVDSWGRERMMAFAIGHQGATEQERSDPRMNGLNEFYASLPGRVLSGAAADREKIVSELADWQGRIREVKGENWGTAQGDRQYAEDVYRGIEYLATAREQALAGDVAAWKNSTQQAVAHELWLVSGRPEGKIEIVSAQGKVENGGLVEVERDGSVYILRVKSDGQIIGSSSTSDHSYVEISVGKDGKAEVISRDAAGQPKHSETIESDIKVRIGENGKLVLEGKISSEDGSPKEKKINLEIEPGRTLVISGEGRETFLKDNNGANGQIIRDGLTIANQDFQADAHWDLARRVIEGGSNAATALNNWEKVSGLVLPASVKDNLDTLPTVSANVEGLKDSVEMLRMKSTFVDYATERDPASAEQLLRRLFVEGKEKLSLPNNETTVKLNDVEFKLRDGTDLQLDVDLTTSQISRLSQQIFGATQLNGAFDRRNLAEVITEILYPGRGVECLRIADRLLVQDREGTIERLIEQMQRGDRSPVFDSERTRRRKTAESIADELLHAGLKRQELADRVWNRLARRESSFTIADLVISGAKDKAQQELSKRLAEVTTTPVAGVREFDYRAQSIVDTLDPYQQVFLPFKAQEIGPASDFGREQIGRVARSYLESVRSAENNAEGAAQSLRGTFGVLGREQIAEQIAIETNKDLTQEQLRQSGGPSPEHYRIADMLISGDRAGARQALTQINDAAVQGLEARVNA
ncbi:MAG: hypothetical protein WC658_04980, partial [Candidatus Omnitrophota bacterium]